MISSITDKLTSLLEKEKEALIELRMLFEKELEYLKKMNIYDLTSNNDEKIKTLNQLEEMEKEKSAYLERLSEFAFDGKGELTLKSLHVLIKNGPQKEYFEQLISEIEKEAELIRLYGNKNQKLAENGLETVKNAFKSITGEVSKSENYTNYGKKEKNISRGSIIEGSM